MEITADLKKRIIEAIKANREFYPSDAKHAIALSLSTSVYNDIKQGKTDKKLSDANWIGIARRLGVTLKKEMPWRAAETSTFVYITEQLRLCQESGISALLCDMPNIGKTFTARIYAQKNKNAVYVDCSQVKTKQRLIRYIAKEFGTNHNGRYNDVYDDLVFYIRSIENPLIILDEAGDLKYEAFLELKALWNASERCCAWYMMGADGLRAKMARSIENEVVGYTEMFSRYGDNYGKVTPDDSKERQKFLNAQVAIVTKLNAPEGTNVIQVVTKSAGSLRRVFTEIEKIYKAV